MGKNICGSRQESLSEIKKLSLLIGPGIGYLIEMILSHKVRGKKIFLSLQHLNCVQLKTTHKPK